MSIIAGMPLSPKSSTTELNSTVLQLRLFQYPFFIIVNNTSEVKIYCCQVHTVVSFDELVDNDQFLQCLLHFGISQLRFGLDLGLIRQLQQLRSC